MILIGFLPQFVYLSSYVNNDIVAVAGVSIIMYSICSGSTRFDGWNIKNTICLAIGSVICILGYLNSLGFVLVGCLFFMFSLNSQVRKGLLRRNQAIIFLFLLIAIIMLTCLPFYIRNILIYNGDLLGMKTFHKRYLLWIRKGGQILQHPSNEQGSLISLLANSDFWITTFKSFTAYFGYMNIQVNTMFYLFYFLVFYTGILGAVIKPNELKEIKLVNLALISGSAITIVLFVYYSFCVDYQPQGRYCMTLLPWLVIITAIGIFRLNKMVTKRNYLLYIFTGIYILFNVILLVTKVWPLIMM